MNKAGFRADLFATAEDEVAALKELIAHWATDFKEVVDEAAAFEKDSAVAAKKCKHLIYKMENLLLDAEERTY